MRQAGVIFFFAVAVAGIAHACDMAHVTGRPVDMTVPKTRRVHPPAGRRAHFTAQGMSSFGRVKLKIVLWRLLKQFKNDENIA